MWTDSQSSISRRYLKCYKRTSGAFFFVLQAKNKPLVPLSDGSRSRKSPPFERRLSISNPHPSGRCWAVAPGPCRGGQFWMGARPFICSPQECSCFHVGDPRPALRRHWPPSFLWMVKKKGHLGFPVWQTKQKKKPSCCCFHTRWKEREYTHSMVRTGSAVKPQIIFVLNHGDRDAQTANTNGAGVRLLWDGLYRSVRPDWR